MKKKIVLISISSAVLLGAVLTAVIIRSKNKNEHTIIKKD